MQIFSAGFTGNTRTARFEALLAAADATSALFCTIISSCSQDTLVRVCVCSPVMHCLKYETTTPPRSLPKSKRRKHILRSNSFRFSRGYPFRRVAWELGYVDLLTVAPPGVGHHQLWERFQTLLSLKSTAPVLYLSLSNPLRSWIENPQAGAASGGAERKGWLVLEGTVGHDGKSIAAVGETQLKILRAAREEVGFCMYAYQLSRFPILHMAVSEWSCRSCRARKNRSAFGCLGGIPKVQNISFR